MLIGVTGQIGAGKTAVVERLREYGAWVVDADKIGKRITGSPAILNKLVRRYGPEIRTPGGRLRPKSLGKLVFAEPGGRGVAELNRLVRPALVREIRREIRAALKKRPARPVVLDAALLPDWDHGLDFDLVILVRASQARRIARLQRRGISPEAARQRLKQAQTLDQPDAARQRMRAQRPLADYRAIADVTLTNDGTLSDLRRSVDRLYRERIAPLGDQ